MRGLLERLLARHREAAGESVADSELLRRFTRERDESAFELLVWRHGAMVLGLCQRAIRDEQLAEDAFQAVFLVLARKAGAVRGNLGGWLFKVARRVATRAAARRDRAHPATDTACEPVTHPVERQELTDLLDAEVSRLPERLRKPVVLCYLGGQSTEDAARELGCPRGTVLSRLATARKHLAERLARRGVALPVVLTVAGVSVTGRVVSATASSAHRFRSGSFAPSPATYLAEGVIRTMTRGTLLTALGGTVLAAAFFSGVGWVAAQQGTKPAPAEDEGVPLAAATRDAEPLAPPAKRQNLDPTEEKQRLDARLQELEKFAASLQDEISVTEQKTERLIADREAREAKNRALLAPLQKRFDDADAEDQQTARALAKLEAELTVLKKRLKALPEITPAMLEEHAARDLRVADLQRSLQQAKDSLHHLAQISPPGDTPAIKAQKENIAKLEKQLEEARKSTGSVAMAMTKANENAAFKERITKLALEIEIQKEVREVLRAERDTLKKQLGDVEFPRSNDIASLRKALDPQREALARVQAEIMRVRLQRGGGVVPREDSTEAKLDLLIREMAELRKEVRELKNKK